MKITLIGAAGVLGSCSAFNLIIQKLADEIIMVDPWESMLKSHWLDLGTMARVYDITVRMGGYEEMAGSDLVIDTATAPSASIQSRSELLPSNLPIIREHAEKIGQYCPNAVVITATNPVDPLNYAMFLLSKHRDRRKTLGYSMNDSVRLRMWAAEELGVKAGRVEGTVIGEHGHSQVMLFSTVRVDGKPVHFDLKTRQKIRAMPPKMLQAYESLTPRRTAGWTTAMGIADTVRAIAGDTRGIIPTNVVLTGEYGVRNMSMTVPAVIGRNGVESILELPLTDEELEGVKNTVATLEPHMRWVERTLGFKMQVPE
jgi:malate/lactate dehydrogenase